MNQKCLTCPNCGKGLKAGRKFCNRACYFASEQFKEHVRKNGVDVGAKGKKKPWVMNHGYRCIYIPEHPHARDGKYVYEHRLVMEEVLNRYLDPLKDVVHHINGVKTDNRPENLVVTNRAEHAKIHDSRIRKQNGQFVKSL